MSNPKRELENGSTRTEALGLNVVHWVNGTESDPNLGKNTKASRERIVGLILSLLEAAKVIAIYPPRESDWMNDIHESLLRLSGDVTQKLALYGSRTGLYVINGKWAFVPLKDSRAKIPFGEYIAADSVVELTKANSLERVRQCICNKWFFATRTDQKSCSPTCRHKNYEQTEQFRQKRRDYMREYYRLKNSGKVK